MAPVAMRPNFSNSILANLSAFVALSQQLAVSPTIGGNGVETTNA